MKDHLFFMAMSYAAVVAVVLIEGWMLHQQRRAALDARAQEKAALLGSDADLAFREGADGVQPAAGGGGMQPGAGGSNPATPTQPGSGAST